jgi:hypothetical protein
MKFTALLIAVLFTTLSAQAEWVADRAYTSITNNVAKWNRNVPLKYFKVIKPDGSRGPTLTDRDRILPLLRPGDRICVKVDTRYNVKFTSAEPGPMNPSSLQCYETGNQN